MNNSEKRNDADLFEENLRHILSNSEPPAARSARPAAPESSEPKKESMDRQEAELRTLFWFKLLRPFAFVALAAMLAIFVLRIIGRGSG